MLRNDPEELGLFAASQGEFGPADHEDCEPSQTGKHGSWAASQDQPESQGTPAKRKGPAQTLADLKALEELHARAKKT